MANKELAEARAQVDHERHTTKTTAVYGDVVGGAPDGVDGGIPDDPKKAGDWPKT